MEIEAKEVLTVALLSSTGVSFWQVKGQSSLLNSQYFLKNDN